MTTLRVIDSSPQAPDDPVAEVRRAFDRLKAAAAANPYPSVDDRRDRLQRLERMLQRNVKPLCDAINADFGGRSKYETLLAEIFTTVEGARHARKRVGRWMKPKSAAVQWFLRPSTARVESMPQGVVAIISAWNYPVNLLLAPFVGALAAGNRVVLKPSELTPKTAELLAQLIRETFAGDEVAIVTGGPDVARAVTSTAFDHILFTGSTRVGREVAKAAAENLTPVTLELGGKSPALIHSEYSLTQAADRIAAGKFFNGGQTCIAPDYVLVPGGKEEAFVRAVRESVGKLYPQVGANPDYTSMANAAGFARMLALAADAEQKGARIEALGPAAGEGSRRYPPTLVLQTTDQMRLMQEEIFGPILPIVSYESLDDAIGFINARPRPLAFYYFDDNQSRATSVLQRTISGGACVNETLLHFVQEELPFGGVGASGMGRYHGYAGFETFSHQRGVYIAGKISAVRALQSPPYTKLLERTMRMFIGSGK